MDTEKPHRTTSSNSSTSELFVCFTSRLSSSSMKLSSKSILSPSRSRDPPQISLSASLSRRLKSNGSMKGGQASPMFPTTGGGKRRGCGFENPEPSSPKVTCIGQVRVKTKKQGKKMRSRSKRRGEASFRRGGGAGGEQGGLNPDLTRQNSQGFQYQNHQSFQQQQECLKHRNQRWVHLPLTICEALREFSCFFPCRSSCMSSEKEKEDKSVGGVGSGGGHGREGSCGAALARWLVALQDGDGKGRGIELVMEHHEEEMEMMEDDDDGREKSERSYSQRRHVFEDIDIDVVEGNKKQEEEEEEEEEKGRVSICIPPKNALLLMRCRSDPVKMAALANRFWESPVKKDQDEEDEGEDSGDEDEEEEEQVEEEEEGDKDQQHIEMEQVEEEEAEQVESKTEEDSILQRETQACVVVASEDPILPEEAEAEESYEIECRTNEELPEAKEEKGEDGDEDVEGRGSGNGNGIRDDQVETFSCVSLAEARADLEKPETEETHHLEGEGKNPKEKENDESAELSSSSSAATLLKASEPENDESATAAKEGSTEEEGEKGTAEKEQQAPTHEGSDPKSTGRGNESREERERGTLPECLLLMMCEPKLSMEVSKETWVCSTDFIRWLPERPAGKPAVAGGGDKRVTVDSSSSSSSKPKQKQKPPQPPMQPPRSSCSFPATGGGSGVSMATMIEQKLMGSTKSQNGYEPFVLTRCKSEPMRSSAKLAPEACFWNNRKLEPHPPPAQLGVGAPAGVGF